MSALAAFCTCVLVVYVYSSFSARVEPEWGRRPAQTDAPSAGLSDLGPARDQFESTAAPLAGLSCQEVTPLDREDRGQDRVAHFSRPVFWIPLGRRWTDRLVAAP